MSTDPQLTPEEINQLLEENSHIIKAILKCQNEGRITDAMLYQTRLQLNLVHLASVANNNKHPSFNTLKKDANKTNKIIKNFVSLVEIHEFKDLNLLANELGIRIDQVKKIATAYIRHLRSQEKISKLEILEPQLKSLGIDIS